VTPSFLFASLAFETLERAGKLREGRLIVLKFVFLMLFGFVGHFVYPVAAYTPDTA